MIYINRKTIYSILYFALISISLAQDFTTREIKMNFGYKPTGQLDTVKAEIIIATREQKISEQLSYKYPNTVLVLINGFIEKEKYVYRGDRMPNGLPNSGGAYDDYYITKRYLDENKNEIKEFVWMSRELK